MEPVTHVLTGLCLARTGLNRRAAYTALTMAIAADFPDIDTLWGFAGPITGFEHHRGITHTFVALPVEAAVVVAAIYAAHRLRMARASKSGPLSANALTAAPVRWGLLYVFALLALLSHLFLDFTNNYGLRPFFPFNRHWYAASITFIFDPWMFLLLLAALVLPSIFRLIGSEVGARRQRFAARGWAIAGLLGIVFLWTLRATQHNRAVQTASAQTITYAPPASDGNSTADADPRQPAPEVATVLLQPQRVLASPDPFSPFRWWTATDYGPVYQLGQADTRHNDYISEQQTEPKLNPGPALQAAEASHLGRVYLDWSPMPFLSIAHDGTEKNGGPLPPGHTLVVFRDPRFLGNIPLMRDRAPLQGVVELDAQNRVVRQVLDGGEGP